MTGHTTSCAYKGVETLVMLKHMHPAVVLLDMEMPHLDGIGFLEAVRKWAGWQATPVLLISGVDDGASVDRAIELGVERVFRKGSYELDDLLACIEEVAGREPQEDGAAV